MMAGDSRRPTGMADQEQQEITEALAAMSRGAPEAMDRHMPLVYRELKRIADLRGSGRVAAHGARDWRMARAWLHEALVDESNS